MTVAFITAPLVCIVGLLIYALSDTKVAEIGRIAFAFGLLVTLLSVANGKLL